MLSGDREMPLTGDEIARFFRVAPGDSVKLSERHTGWAQTAELQELGKNAVKERAAEILQSEQRELSEQIGRAHV